MINNISQYQGESVLIFAQNARRGRIDAVRTADYMLRRHITYITYLTSGKTNKSNRYKFIFHYS